MSSICDNIQIPRINLPHKNCTTHDHYSRYYDSESRKLVEDRYREDIDAFGYSYTSQ